MAGRLPKPGTIEVAPSILSADFANLASEIRQVTEAGVRMVHLDIMDGHFVPNLTIGPPVVKWIRRCTEAVLDVHLMITDPQRYAPRFIEAGADHITFHIETVKNPFQMIEELHAQGVSAGVTLNPATPVESVFEAAPLCEMVLVMTVEPGFGGQEFMDFAARKCLPLRERFGPSLRIEVDGGINAQTAPLAVGYGADTLVAGQAVFGEQDRAGAIRRILESAARAARQ
ncbi:MAG TPA: ribulose-phosphate 3-epimerase [Anaerohalosphaeraceae bacterium]|nr:ribulose-phosphate 3-epimerase [Anaerohalosphaeraceae bacterium]HQG05358.1 ribulose-phosphate 3-epimerase [Anaerohalosphaeraceae bacterium]HQI06731.1 ribulose-phosphate 3-epimerase [Anaerohalosphaeraceae bacterium]HQJ67152.1 ribulose-phosphate 3-epimerase [Anaerohalosphaeraceae bacterium]